MNTSNSTLSPTPFALPGKTLGLTVLSLAFILGFPGNAFVVWSAGCRVRKRTVTCLLILHLAIADLAVLLTAPLFLQFLVAGHWGLGEGICKACHYICGVSMYSSVFLITLMSLDRCMAVSMPFVSQKIRTKKIIRLLVLGIWVTAVFLAIPVLIYRKMVNKFGRSFCTLYHPSKNEWIFHNLFETITGFVLPFVAILCSYGTITRRLGETRFRRKRRTSRLICLIVVAFAIFWLPYHVVNLLDVAGLLSGSDRVKKAGQNARPTLIALAFFSSSVNPILYAFSGSSFIRSAGLGFMAKLFEGTASEMSSVKHSASRDTKCHRDVKTNPDNNEAREFLTMSTNPTSSGTSQGRGETT